jgi:hypothetical protein
MVRGLSRLRKNKQSQVRIATTTKVAFGTLIPSCILYFAQSGAIWRDMQKNHNNLFMLPPQSLSWDSSSSTTSEEDKDALVSTRGGIGISVVHCKEDNMTFLDQVPHDWRPFKVYENCGQRAHPNASAPFKNAGSEECTAYLDYVIANYDNLPEVSVFIQSDALRGYRKDRKVTQAHTPFASIPEMANHIQRAFKDAQQGFLHFGPPLNFGSRVWNGNYIGHYLNETWNDMGLLSTPTTEVKTRPGACFAAKKDRILSVKKETYKTIQSRILSSNSDVARRRCCALEISWHVLFGEPAILPETSSMDHLYKNISWQIW